MTTQTTGGSSAPQRPAGRSQGPRRGRRYYSRRKVCSFCVDHIKHIDYRNTDLLRRFLSDQYKIEGRRKTGVCARHQRELSRAVKRARHLALLPFTTAHRIPDVGWVR